MGELTLICEGLRFPEGPAFAPDGSLWLAELNGKSLVQYHNGNLRGFEVGGKPNGIAIDNEGLIWFCDAEINAIRCFNPKTEVVEDRVSNINGEELAHPNDLAFDEAGNLIFTCPGNSRQEPTGYVCVLQKSGAVKKVIKDKYFPNGLVFVDGGKQLILAETYRQRLWKGDWNTEACEYSNASIFTETGGPIGPDGMAVAASGNLYVAVYGSSQVKIYNQQGNDIGAIDLPGSNPTNCAFDPNWKMGLVITEAEKGLLLSFKEKA